MLLWSPPGTMSGGGAEPKVVDAWAVTDDAKSLCRAERIAKGNRLAGARTLHHYCHWQNII
jgi:hypothetical protein